MRKGREADETLYEFITSAKLIYMAAHTHLSLGGEGEGREGVTGCGRKGEGKLNKNH